MDVEAFIARWTAREGGAERANYQMYLSEVCDVIGVPRPDPAGSERGFNDYVFERAVRRRQSDTIVASRRIDLYKKGCFILEAKQSRLPGNEKSLPAQISPPVEEHERLGRRGTARNWDVLMQHARRQAEEYVFLLEAAHPAPPFIVTCDVGHAFEIFADFSGTGRAYSQFPDRKGFRIYLEDLRRAEIRELLARIWTDPASLDPARVSARVTREVAKRLAAVSRSLEAKHPPEEVAQFLMRCIFCMFAEDVDLLPKGEFTRLLDEAQKTPRSLIQLLEELWSKMDQPDRDKRYFSYFIAHLKHFNGHLYRNARALPLSSDEVGELLAAAKCKWTEVDPAIFGTLLEQALDKTERKRLGAHYTPRSYVQRLVEVTVMEPLRADWQVALKQAEAQKDAGNEQRAIKIVKAFHRRLCHARVLDPACGTGNFLYVSLELMKKLEGEVLETEARLGAPESLGLDSDIVSPRQFLGLELNPRAAAIAELVVWIGYLQQHYKTHSGHPGEPILKAFGNINFGRKEGYDALLAWDGYPMPQVAIEGGRCIETYPNARRAAWPEAEFIVGNPPFIGKGAAMRGALGDPYVEALTTAYRPVNESADLVMYWWDRAAELLTRQSSVVRRVGLVTTNSVSQTFNRRTVERHLTARNPASIIFAIPDHPWTKATPDAAAVRIAMTVIEAGTKDGILQSAIDERALETDEPLIKFDTRTGPVNPDLTVGTNVTRARALASNGGVSWNGMMLAARGFLLTASEARDIANLDGGASAPFIKPFLNGADLVRKPQNRFVIDLFGIAAPEARKLAPSAYSHLLFAVRPERSKARDRTFREKWWMFGRPRPDLREALAGCSRYIGTTETSKHRLFQFIDATVVPDHMIISIAVEDAWLLAVLSSKIHTAWSVACGGRLGVGNDSRYSKSRCFDPFPFPDPSEAVKKELREAGEELDAIRKRALNPPSDLTLTGLYNVVDKLRAGRELNASEETICNKGFVPAIAELHDLIDGLTMRAYGWPSDVPDADMLARLVALNADRTIEEAKGHIRWLRPEFQAQRHAKPVPEKAAMPALSEQVSAIDKRLPPFPSHRDEQVLAVEAMLLDAEGALEPAEVARRYRRGGKRIERRVGEILISLARYGHVTALPNGTFAARRAA